MCKTILEIAKPVYKSRSDDPIKISMDISDPRRFNEDDNPTLDYNPGPVITIVDCEHAYPDNNYHRCINPLVETINDHEKSVNQTLRVVIQNVVDTPSHTVESLAGSGYLLQISNSFR